jgi:hypothetical protein
LAHTPEAYVSLLQAKTSVTAVAGRRRMRSITAGIANHAHNASPVLDEKSPEIESALGWDCPLHLLGMTIVKLLL